MPNKISHRSLAHFLVVLIAVLGISPRFMPSHAPQDIFLQSNVLGIEFVPESQSKIHNCLQQELTPSQYQLYFDPEGQQRPLSELGATRLERASTCFQTLNMDTLPEPQKECLQQQLADRFQEIQSGEFITPSDIFNASPCYPTPFTYAIHSRSQKLSNTEQMCLYKNIDDFEQWRQNPTQLTSEQIKNTRLCIFSQSPITQTPITVQTTPNTANCLYDKIGTKRLMNMLTGKNPTQEEIQEANNCISFSERNTQYILPAQIELLGLISTSEQVKITNVSISEIPQTGQQIIQISGQGPAQTLIDIHILPTKITLSTTSDSEGHWIARTSFPFQPGDYSIYAVHYINETTAEISQLPISQRTKSPPYEFSVIKKIQTPINTNEQIRVIPTASRHIAIQIGLATILLLVAIAILRWAYQKSPTNSKTKPKSLPLP